MKSHPASASNNSKALSKNSKKEGPVSNNRAFCMEESYFLIQRYSPVRIMLVFLLMWGFHSMILCQSLMP